jgi:hypothetical protein
MTMTELENEIKKEAKIRTSITIDPAVLNDVRKVCENASRSVSSYIEDALKEKMLAEAKTLNQE